ncbi:hypothetical protein [uncultured Dokdonia sp.]|uniref:hypothetical protein n=1 Tax=uncultured Dokdonia sp. TaxID=575653 RepID=UPI002626889F|nr:hypothetical protein [uncultured Dokdonia sp.]
MIGILVIPAISWILLYLTEKKSILALGIYPISARLKQLGIGFLVIALLCFNVQLLESILESSDWSLNQRINTNLILETFVWNLKSVITEELIFRGAILYVFI